MAVGDARPRLLVYDEAGVLFDLLRSVPWEGSLRRAVDGIVERIDVDADLAVVAAYDRTDWTMAARLVNEMPTVVLSARFDRAKANRALSAGLMGYLDASLPKVALGRALSGVLRGEPAYEREALGRWLRSQPSMSKRLALESSLTPRQQEVMAFVARGSTDKEIAASLGISTETAQKHVAHILERLGVPNRAAAVAVLSGVRP